MWTLFFFHFYYVCLSFLIFTFWLWWSKVSKNSNEGDLSSALWPKRSKSVNRHLLAKSNRTYLRAPIIKKRKTRSGWNFALKFFFHDYILEMSKSFVNRRHGSSNLYFSPQNLPLCSILNRYENIWAYFPFFLSWYSSLANFKMMLCSTVQWQPSLFLLSVYCVMLFDLLLTFTVYSIGLRYVFAIL